MAEYPKVTVSHYLQQPPDPKRGVPVERYAAEVEIDGETYSAEGFQTEQEAIDTLRRVFRKARVFPNLPREYEVTVAWDFSGPESEFFLPSEKA